jgi:hypothetical protein
MKKIIVQTKNLRTLSYAYLRSCMISKEITALGRSDLSCHRTLAARGLEELFFQLCCCVSFWFWRGIDFGFTYTYVLRVQYNCGVVLVFWFWREIVFCVT